MTSSTTADQAHSQSGASHASGDRPSPKLNLRKLARGQNCQVRLPGCLHSPETVVLAHLRRGSTAGIGQKPPDLCGVYACAACHDLIDRRKMVANLSRQEIDAALLPALCRTLAIVSREIEI